MPASDQAFNQVRRILEKIDRSIDEARQRRTTPVPGIPANRQAPGQDNSQVLRANRIERPNPPQNGNHP